VVERRRKKKKLLLLLFLKKIMKLSLPNRQIQFLKGTDVTNTTSTELKQEEPVIVTQLPKKYRIGIICSPNNYTDIKVYNDEFRKINEKYGDNVTLIFIGYDYKEDKQKILDGVNLNT
jgi:hypothetical protein